MNKLLIGIKQPSIKFSAQNTPKTSLMECKKNEPKEILVANHNVLITHANDDTLRKKIKTHKREEFSVMKKKKR